MHLQVSKINWKLEIQNQIPEIWNWTSSKFEMRAQVPADHHGGGAPGGVRRVWNAGERLHREEGQQVNGRGLRLRELHRARSRRALPRSPEERRGHPQGRQRQPHGRQGEVGAQEQAVRAEERAPQGVRQHTGIDDRRVTAAVLTVYVRSSQETPFLLGSNRESWS